LHIRLGLGRAARRVSVANGLLERAAFSRRPFVLVLKGRSSPTRRLRTICRLAADCAAGVRAAARAGYFADFCRYDQRANVAVSTTDSLMQATARRCSGFSLESALFYSRCCR